MKNTYNWPKPAEMDNGPFVFVSYSHANHTLLQADLKRMHALKVALWYDRAIVPSEDWYKRATTVMSHPNCVGAVFYISKQSLLSMPCYRELQFALGMKKKRAFSICSVNIGGKTLQAMLQENTVPVAHKRLYGKVFGDEVIFVPRSSNAKNNKHERALLRYYDACGLLANEYKSLLEDRAFDYVQTEQGAYITRYTGELSEVVVPATVDGHPVYGIGPMAFSNNARLKKVVLEDGIEVIEPHAFFRCAHLQEIHLSDTLREIGYASFQQCEVLKKVVFPNSLRELGDYSFYMCGELEAVDFGLAHVQIGYAAFSQCMKLASLRISPNTRGIRGYAFGGCAIGRLKLWPKNLVSLGEDICVCNEKLRYIEWQSDRLLDKLPLSLFSLCPIFEGILVPYGMPQANVEKLEQYGPVQRYLPEVNGLTHDEKGFLWYAEKGAVGYRVKIDGEEFDCKHPRLDYPLEKPSYEVEITAYAAEDNIVQNTLRTRLQIRRAVIVGKRLDGGGGVLRGTLDCAKLRVDEISDDAYRANLAVRKVYTGKVRNIGAYAFEACTLLEQVSVDTDCHVGDFAFSKCNRLKRFVVADEEGTSFGKGALSECLSLTEVKLGKRRVLPEKLLYRCCSLKTVDLEGVEVLGRESLRGCMELDVSVLPEGLLRVEDNAVSYICIRTIHLPQSLVYLADGNLQHCTYLEEITVAEGNPYFSARDGVLYQGDSLWRYPPAKTDECFTVSGAKEIAKLAFADQVYLQKLVVQGDVALADGAVYNCDSLQEVIFEGNAVLGKGVFKGCDQLKRVCFAVRPEGTPAEWGLSDEVEVCILS